MCCSISLWRMLARTIMLAWSRPLHPIIYNELTVSCFWIHKRADNSQWETSRHLIILSFFSINFAICVSQPLLTTPNVPSFWEHQHAPVPLTSQNFPMPQVQTSSFTNNTIKLQEDFMFLHKKNQNWLISFTGNVRNDYQVYNLRIKEIIYERILTSQHSLCEVVNLTR